MLPRRCSGAACREGYTGPQGARGTDYAARVVDGGAEYETTRPLARARG